MLSPEKISTILDSMGFEALNIMQEAALSSIPHTPASLLLAPTGSGKTLAFLLPVLAMMQSDKEGVQCIVLSPTRELCLQIESVWKQMSTGYKVNTVYGGHDLKIEKQSLTETPALLVGTPGRLADHLRRGTFEPTTVTTLVLDEFDKSLEMGFQDEMIAIIDAVENVTHSILASATEAENIPAFAGVQNPEILDFREGPNTQLMIRWVYSPGQDFAETVRNILRYVGGEPTIVFMNHREAVESLSEWLWRQGVHNIFFHGGLDQPVRERTLIRFRNGSAHTLVSTDLAARGLDIPEVKHIIHFQYPQTEEPYIHRNGRTARMNAEGTVWNIYHDPHYVPRYLQIPREESDKVPMAGNPPFPEWETVYISGGKKDKVNKIDIVGFFCQKGGIQKSDIGKIEVLDHMAFVAVKVEKVKGLIREVRDQKMKGKKFKIEIAQL